MSIEFGEYKRNEKYNSGAMKVTTSPILLRNVFTFGVQKSKFDAKKHTVTFCLDSEQLERVESVRGECLKALEERKVGEVKSGLYADKMYVKVDPDSFSTYRGEEELDFKEVKGLKNFNASVAVDVRCVYVSKGVAHLQLYLYELEILPEEAAKPKGKRERLLRK